MLATRVGYGPVKRLGRLLSACLITAVLALPGMGCDQVDLSRLPQVLVTPTAGPLPATALVVPLRIVESPGGGVLAFVQVGISGQGPFSFALDTGASHSLVDSGVVARLELPVVGRAQGVIGITGGTGETALVRIEEWRAGDVPLPAATVVSLDLPSTSRQIGFHGLLGSDMLSRFGAVTVDYERQELVLRERP